MAKNYTVLHSMLGSVDPEHGANHRQGEVVPADHLGDAKAIARLVRVGAVRESTKDEVDATELTKENAKNQAALQEAEASGDPKAYADALAKVTTGNDKTAKQKPVENQAPQQ